MEPDQFAWVLPFAVFGLPAVLALFTGLGFAIARALWRSGPGRILALAFGLGVSEWLRAVVATGFPWNAFGMALGGNGVLAQPAAFVGLHGLNVLAVLIFAAQNDTVVDSYATERFAARLKIGRMIMLESSRHEILIEQDPVRARFWAGFDAFIPGATGEAEVLVARHTKVA